MKNYKYFIEHLTNESVSSLDLAFEDYLSEVEKIIKEDDHLAENDIINLMSQHQDRIYDFFAKNVSEEDCADELMDDNTVT